MNDNKINDTAVVLQGVDGEKLIYCIYEENILPDVPYIWQGATHIPRSSNYNRTFEKENRRSCYDRRKRISYIRDNACGWLLN